jgi:uncharacterized protein YwgA
MNRLETASILLSLVERLKEQGNWAGETHVQKATYLLSKVLRVPLNFEFILYKHGPFSFDLRNELNALRAEGFMAWEIRRFLYGPSLKAGELGEALKTQFSSAPQTYRDQIDFVARKIGGKDVQALERFATAVLVTLEEEHTNTERANRIHQLKPHVTLPEAESAVREADEFLAEAQAHSAPKVAAANH